MTQFHYSTAAEGSASIANVMLHFDATSAGEEPWLSMFCKIKRYTMKSVTREEDTHETNDYSWLEENI